MEITEVKQILTTHLQKTKLHGDKYIQSLCPFHSESEPSFVYYFDNDYYKCFSCGAHGHLNDLLKLWGMEDKIEVSPKDKEDKKEFTIEKFIPTKANFDEIYELSEKYFHNLHGITSKQFLESRSVKINDKHTYWLNRGISIDTLVQMGIGCGEDGRGFFYSVPYFWIDDDKEIKAENFTVIAIKKIYPHQGKEGKKDSYATYPEGISIPLYHEAALLYAKQTGKTVGIFEGEKDVIMAVDQGLGRTSVGIAGKNAFKTSYLPLFSGIQKVVLFLDNDADKEMDDIIEMFNRYRNVVPHLPKVRKLNWGLYDLPKGGDYTDLIHMQLLKV